MAEHNGVAGRALLDYPLSVTVPLDGITWDDEDRLVPISGLTTLSVVQRLLLEQWLQVVNETDKVATTRQRVPQHAVADPVVRTLLAEAGYDVMTDSPQPSGPRDTLIAWHSIGSTSPTGEHSWRLIPLRQFVNHDPSGAPQEPAEGSVRLLTSASSDSGQTFENYGDMDALRLLMIFGYVPDHAPSSTPYPSSSMPVLWESCGS